jgi:hypothetical protein
VADENTSYSIKLKPHVSKLSVKLPNDGGTIQIINDGKILPPEELPSTRRPEHETTTISGVFSGCVDGFGNQRRLDDKVINGKIFICYSKRDSSYLEDIKSHLSVFKWQKVSVEIWCDRDIDLGGLWDLEIKKALSSSRVAILLVSSYFLNTDYIRITEFPCLLERSKRELTLIVPIIVSRCSLPESITQFQMGNFNKPLDEMIQEEKNKFYEKLVNELRKLLCNYP